MDHFLRVIIPHVLLAVLVFLVTTECLSSLLRDFKVAQAQCLMLSSSEIAVCHVKPLIQIFPEALFLSCPRW